MRQSHTVRGGGERGGGGCIYPERFFWRRIDFAPRFKLSEPVDNVGVTAAVVCIAIAAETLAKSGARDEVRDEPGGRPRETEGERV